jgi:hypothetical protein
VRKVLPWELGWWNQRRRRPCQTMPRVTKICPSGSCSPPSRSYAQYSQGPRSTPVHVAAGKSACRSYHYPLRTHGTEVFVCEATNRGDCSAATQKNSLATLEGGERKPLGHILASRGICSAGSASNIARSPKKHGMGQADQANSCMAGQSYFRPSNYQPFFGRFAGRARGCEGRYDPRTGQKDLFWRLSEDCFLTGQTH